MSDQTWLVEVRLKDWVADISSLPCGRTVTYVEVLRDADDRSMSVNTFERNDPVQAVVQRLLQARGEQVPAAAELFDVTVFGLDEEFVRVWFIEAYEFTMFSFTRKEIDALCTSS